MCADVQLCPIAVADVRFLEIRKCCVYWRSPLFYNNITTKLSFAVSFNGIEHGLYVFRFGVVIPGACGEYIRRRGKNIAKLLLGMDRVYFLKAVYNFAFWNICETLTLVLYGPSV